MISFWNRLWSSRFMFSFDFTFHLEMRRFVLVKASTWLKRYAKDWFNIRLRMFMRAFLRNRVGILIDWLWVRRLTHLNRLSIYDSWIDDQFLFRVPSRRWKKRSRLLLKFSKSVQPRFRDFQRIRTYFRLMFLGLLASWVWYFWWLHFWNMENINLLCWKSDISLGFILFPFNWRRLWRSFRLVYSRW